MEFMNYQIESWIEKVAAVLFEKSDRVLTEFSNAETVYTQDKERGLFKGKTSLEKVRLEELNVLLSKHREMNGINQEWSEIRKMS